LYPVFRDRDELPSSSDLSANIRQALAGAQCLIVICSPRSAASRWVNEEIKSFKALGRESRVLALVVDGEPNATDRPELGMPEAFPEALRFRVSANGEITRDRVEPIAADARPGKDGKANALLKIIAGVAAVGYDELKRRERARRVRRRIAWSGAVAGLLLLGIGGWRIQENRRVRELATRQSRTDFVAGSDLLDRGDHEAGLLRLARALRLDSTFRAPAMRIGDYLRRHRVALARGRRMTHAEEITTASYSGDGARIVTAARDGTARIWDAFSGAPLTPPLVHETSVNVASFSPDGTRLLTLTGAHGRPGSLAIWDAATGTRLARAPAHSDFIFEGDWSPDGRRVVTSSADRTARIWDARTGELLREIAHPDYVGSARFDAEGARIVTACNDGVVRVVDAATGRLLHALPSRERLIRRVWFSPDGAFVLARSDRTLEVWSAATGAAAPSFRAEGEWLDTSPETRGTVTVATADGTIGVRDRLTGSAVGPPLRHPKPVGAARQTRDGSRVITWSEDGLIRLWNARSGALLAEPLRAGGEVSVLAWSPDEHAVLVGSGVRNQGGSARVWLLPAETSHVAVRSLPRAGYVARFSSDGATMVTAGGSNDSGHVSIWNGATLERRLGPLSIVGRIESVELSADGSRVLLATGYCGQPGAVHLLNTTSGAAAFPPIEQLDGALAATFSRDGSRIASVSCGRSARVWNAHDGTPISPYLRHNDRVNAIDFSPDGTMLLTGTGTSVGTTMLDRYSGAAATPPPTPDDAAMIWSAASGRIVTGPIAFSNAVRAVRFSPDGSALVSAAGSSFRGGASAAQVWDAKTGSAISAVMPLAGTAEWAEWSPDGRRVLTAHSESAARGAAFVWDARSGSAVTGAMAHAGAVRFARFSADGSLVVTASADSTARLWDATTGHPVSAPLRHDSPVESVAWSSDGRRLLTATSLQTVSVWDVATPVSPDSLVVLSDLVESIVGSRLLPDESVAVSSRTIDELVESRGDLKKAFPTLLAPLDRFTTRRDSSAQPGRPRRG
jgi:WD40 repeat protein